MQVMMVADALTAVPSPMCRRSQSERDRATVTSQLRPREQPSILYTMPTTDASGIANPRMLNSNSTCRITSHRLQWANPHSGASPTGTPRYALEISGFAGTESCDTVSGWESQGVADTFESRRGSTRKRNRDSWDCAKADAEQKPEDQRDLQYQAEACMNAPAARGRAVCDRQRRMCQLFGRHTRKRFDPRREVHQRCVIDGVRRKHAVHAQDGTIPDIVEVVVWSSPEVEHAQHIRAHTRA
eukprot:3438305-Rhodomonas_salina.1